ncbi:MAG: FkbM family methyltransferase [Nitrososphaeria archaeon]
MRPGELLGLIGRYRRVYANWPSVLWAVHRRSGRIRVRLRMGPELEVPYSIASQLSLLADLGAGLEEVRGDLAKLRLPEGISLWVRLNRGFDVGHVRELFVDRAYGSSFSGTVVDVGASNGDSAIFFALNGAERVVALEPDPESFALAEENVRINGLEGRIRLVNAALAAEDGEAEFLVPEGSPNAATLSPTRPVSRIVDFGRSRRLRVRTISLVTLMKELGPDGASLLKMDCEGCEYEVLRSAGPDLLARFRRIILEYHDGPRDLPDILGSAGFSVSCSRESGLGILRAERPRGPEPESLM